MFRDFFALFADKTKKKGILFVFYLCFCLSLRRYYFRYLRSNAHTLILIINILDIYSAPIEQFLT